MIAFFDPKPMLQLPDGELCSLDEGWLLESIQYAARKAGYSDGWLAQDFYFSILRYLEEEYPEPGIALKELSGLLQKILCLTGYEDIAAHFQLSRPPVRVSLGHLAAQAGGGYELAFFALLEEQLQGILRSGSQNAHFVHLGSCVRSLVSAKKWSKKCSLLMDEIISYIDKRLRDAPGRILFLVTVE